MSKLFVVTEPDCGQREAASIYYSAYFLMNDGADPVDVKAALERREPVPLKYGRWLLPEFVIFGGDEAEEEC